MKKMLVSIVFSALLVLAAIVMLANVALATEPDEKLAISAVALENGDIKNIEPVEIGKGPLKVSVHPIRIVDVLNKDATRITETIKGIGTAAISAKNIRAISISPKTRKIRAEIQTEAGIVLQEIPRELKPVVNYKKVLIEQDFPNKKIILTEGESIVETKNELEVNDGLMIKSEAAKKKISILPKRALQIIKEKARIEPAKVVLKMVEKNQKPIYNASEIKRGKILGILPVEFKVEVSVDAQSGEAKVMQPFWRVLVVE